MYIPFWLAFIESILCCVSVCVVVVCWNAFTKRETRPKMSLVLQMSISLGILLSLSLHSWRS